MFVSFVHWIWLLFDDTEYSPPPPFAPSHLHITLFLLNMRWDFVQRMLHLKYFKPRKESPSQPVCLLPETHTPNTVYKWGSPFISTLILFSFFSSCCLCVQWIQLGKEHFMSSVQFILNFPMDKYWFAEISIGRLSSVSNINNWIGKVIDISLVFRLGVFLFSLGRGGCISAHCHLALFSISEQKYKIVSQNGFALCV